MFKALLKPASLATLLFLILLGSLAGCYFLFDKAVDFYRREAEVRLQPVNYRYARDNERLLAEQKQRPRVIIFGESRCGMWLPHHPTNWGDLEIVNRGIGGETTAQIQLRLESDVLALDPDLVILQMGDNDLKSIAVLPERHRSIQRLTEENIKAIARSIGERGVPVIVTTIFPTGPIEWLRRPLWSDEVTQAIDEVNQALLDFSAPNVAVVDCDVFLRDGTYIKDEYSLDTLHLTPAGYQALNQALAPYVAAALER